MCGIAGAFSLNGIDRDQMRQATDCLKHRGPDAGGYYSNPSGTVFLGHRRLSIIDLSEAANQPIFSADGRYTIIFNGEVYNFQDIREEILAARPDTVFKTHSDTEVVLQSFILWGAAAARKWNGMFAVVIWDEAEQKLSLFRDRLGKKPLYYYHRDGRFVFSSELKSFAVLPFVDRETNAEAITAYLHLGYIPGPMTIYRHVHKMEAGSAMTVQGMQMSTQVFWTPEDAVQARRISDEREALDTLQQLLESSVRYRMISDVPFGAFLSGGIDSSIVTAVAQSISATPVNTFSIGFKESKFDESRFAAAVAQHLGTRHHEFIVSEQDAIAMVDRMVDAYDEPYADSSAIPTMLVSKLARQHVTMTLSGDGGDELFHGYGMYQWAARLARPGIWPFRSLIATALKMGSSRLQRAAGVFEAPDRASVYDHIFSQEQYLFSGRELNNGLLKTGHPWQPLPFALPAARQLTPAEQQALFDIRYYLKDDLLVKVDRASMQFSLETRAPLLDYRIVEFALNLDPALKVKDGVQKYLLKELLYRYVPRSFFERPKWGFAVPLVRWLKTDLKYLIDQNLSTEVVQQFGWVDAARVNQLKEAYFKGGKDYLYNRLWSLAMLHLWARKHMG